MDIADPGCSELPRPPDSSTLTGIDAPGWKHLVLGPIPMPERISLITAILSNEHELEVVGRLCGDDAQAFIDIIYEAPSSYSFISEG